MYLWARANIAAEANASGTVLTSYVRGIGLLSGENLQDNASQSYLFNAHGDVVQLADSTGDVLWEYDYDAFGNEKDIEGQDKSLDDNPFRYCGEYFDEETGDIYLRARYYNPRLGRFGAEDPIRDGLNWYTYCGGNPVLFVDPSGLEARMSLEDYIKSQREKERINSEASSSSAPRESLESYLKKQTARISKIYKIRPPKISAAGIEYIKAFEDFRAYPYRGIDLYNETIGYGYVILPDENFSGGLTEQQATELLYRDLELFEENLNKFIANNGLYFNQSQYDALISFSFNLGKEIWTTKYDEWDVIPMLATGSWTNQDILYEFQRFDKSGNIIAEGIWRRHANDAHLFTTGDYTVYETHQLNSMGYHWPNKP